MAPSFQKTMSKVLIGSFLFQLLAHAEIHEVYTSKEYRQVLENVYKDGLKDLSKEKKLKALDAEIECIGNALLTIEHARSVKVNSCVTLSDKFFALLGGLAMSSSGMVGIFGLKDMINPNTDLLHTSEIPTQAAVSLSESSVKKSAQEKLMNLQKHDAYLGTWLEKYGKNAEQAAELISRDPFVRDSFMDAVSKQITLTQMKTEKFDAALGLLKNSLQEHHMLARNFSNSKRITSPTLVEEFRSFITSPKTLHAMVGIGAVGLLYYVYQKMKKHGAIEYVVELGVEEAEELKMQYERILSELTDLRVAVEREQDGEE